MNLELNKSTGNLFVNKSEFFFDNEQFISNNIFLKKHLKGNGFDTYGFEVVFFEPCLIIKLISNPKVAKYKDFISEAPKKIIFFILLFFKIFRTSKISLKLKLDENFTICRFIS